MKKIVTILIMIAMSLSFLYAEFKIAYVNSNIIYTSSEKVKLAEKEYQDNVNAWQEQIDNMSQEITNLENDYKLREAMLTDSAKQEAQGNIQRKYIAREELYKSIFGQNGLAAKKNEELLDPIAQEINEIIERVAIENNYDMVIDVAAGSLVYAKEKYDITSLVVEEMGSTEVTEPKDK